MRIHSADQSRLSLCVVGCPFVAALRDPEALLERYDGLVRWAEAVREAGADDVTVVQRFHREHTLRRQGIRYRFVADGGPPTALPPWFTSGAVVRAVKATGADVVHVDGLVFPMLVRHLRLRLPRSTVVLAQDHGGIHQGSPGFQSWRWRLLHRFGLRAADGFLFSARELADVWRQAGVLAARQKVYEIMESSSSLEAPPAELPAPGRALPGRPALLWVGRLDENKDPLTVLDGFEQAAVQLPEAALSMVFSEDELLAPVRARIAASSVLASRVHLLGRLDRGALARLYAAADVFVLGSHHEGSGFALIEALSFGVTPVVTDIPTFRVLTGATPGGRTALPVGALFPVESARELAAAILRVCEEDRALARERVSRHFSREFSWPVLGQRALAIYRLAHARRHDPRVAKADLPPP